MNSSVPQELQRLFVVGFPRSGTTLLQSVIGAHPQVFTLPETQFFMRVVGAGPQKYLGLIRPRAARVVPRMELVGLDFHKPSIARLPDPRIRAWTHNFVTSMDEAAGPSASAWLEKTPMHLHQVDLIERLVPRSRFLHIIRDGVDAVSSLVTATLASDQAWKRLPRDRDTLLERAADRWVEDLRRSRACVGRPQHIFVSYEQLVERGEGLWPPLLARLHLPVDGATISEMQSRREAVGQQIRLSHESWKSSVTEAVGVGRTPSVVTDAERGKIADLVTDHGSTVAAFPYVT